MPLLWSGRVCERPLREWREADQGSLLGLDSKGQLLYLGVVKNMFSETIVLGVSWGFKHRETLLRAWEQRSSQ